jgi:hypothetical protein
MVNRFSFSHLTVTASQQCRKTAQQNAPKRPQSASKYDQNPPFLAQNAPTLRQPRTRTDEGAAMRVSLKLETPPSLKDKENHGGDSR